LAGSGGGGVNLYEGGRVAGSSVIGKLEERIPSGVIMIAMIFLEMMVVILYGMVGKLVGRGG
jgi:hypothetical protein